MMHNEVGERGVEDGRGIEFLAGDGSADHGEDAGTDDGSDAKRRQRPGAERLLEAVLGRL